MFSLVVTLVLSVPEVPPQCAAPPQRDMAPLTQFAQTSGSLSVGLDSVATWCFDSGGGWTGGGKKANANAAPSGDCKKAIAACEGSKSAISSDARQLMYDTLAEIDRPFLGVKYTPRRSGLAERPTESAECTAKERSTLFAHAQARMDLARLASVTQNEYANFRTWLFSEGLKCAQAVARGETDLTRRGIAVDAVVQGGGTQKVPGSKQPQTGAGTSGTAGTSNSNVGAANGSTGGTNVGGGSAVAGTNTSAASGTAGIGTNTGATGGSATAGSGGVNSGGSGGSAMAGGANSGAAGASGGSATAGSGGASSVAAGGASGGSATAGSGGANSGSAGGASGGSATAGSGGANSDASGGSATAGSGGANSGSATAGSGGANNGASGGSTTAGTGGANSGGAGAKSAGVTSAGATGSAGSKNVGGSATTGAGGANTATGGTLVASAGTTGANGPRNPNTPFLGGPTAEREKALGSSMLEKWRYFLGEQQKLEGDIDWSGGFLASRELRDCRCVRPAPGEVVHKLEANPKDTAVAADDDKNTRCELCLLDAYPRWKVRSQKQCALALELTEYELGVLQRSDDGNGLPQRCVDAAKDKLAGNSGRAGKVTFGGDGSTKPATGGHFIIMKNEPPAATPAPTPAAPAVAAVAAMPPREDGRKYVRVFTSSTCVAEMLPGPVEAHNGDVLPVPTTAGEITVRGSCGGIAELYFGKEEKPRVSEPFSKDKPLKLQFRR